MAAPRHGNTPNEGKTVTPGSATPYTTSVDANKIASSLPLVNLLVKVFCWLRWWQPRSSTLEPSDDRKQTSAPWANAGPRPRQCVIRVVQNLPKGLPGESAEANDHSQTRGDHAQLLRKSRRAGVALAGCRLVLRRGAADGGAHARADEPPPVARRHTRGLRGQTRPVQ